LIVSCAMKRLDSTASVKRPGGRKSGEWPVKRMEQAVACNGRPRDIVGIAL
jgi:hypothetical protein